MWKKREKIKVFNLREYEKIENKWLYLKIKFMPK